MKKLLPSLLLIICFSCQQNSNKEKTSVDSFTLKGRVNGDYTGFIYLNYGTKKDSSKVINQQFSFKGTVKKPIQGWLNLEPTSNVAWIYIENSEIDIKTSFEKKNQNEKSINYLQINTIAGSKSAQIRKEYQRFFKTNKSKKNFKKLLLDKLETFLKENSEHPFSGAILGELALVTPIFSKEKLLQLQSIIDTTKQHEGDLKMFEMGIVNMDNYTIGNKFPEFELFTHKSKKKHLSDFTSKFTLIDFWASWCAPCRVNHPTLINLKKQFSEDKFDILSISIDENKDQWITAIEKDKLTWNNVIDTNKKVSDQLRIPGVPFNYLINEKGIIIGVNVSIENLKNRLLKKFNQSLTSQK